VVDKKLLAIIGDVIVETLDPLIRRIEALEAQQKNVRFRGTFQRAESYQKGNFSTHDGSLWCAVRDEPGTPGDGDGWQLCAKRGRDADRRDAR
jgi:hypothetical protein